MTLADPPKAGGGMPALTRLAIALALAACASTARPPARAASPPYTVFVFFAEGCPVQKAHDARLAAIAREYGPRGVAFVALDPDPDATPSKAAEATRTHGLPFPVRPDAGAALAKRFGAEQSTYTVVTDRDGHVHYRGGIDSDRVSLHADAKNYLRDALDDLLAGRPPRVAETRALGCPLTLR